MQSILRIAFAMYCNTKWPDFFQFIMVSETYPWWAGAIAAFLVLSSVLCIPGVAISRKLGFFKFEGPTAKNIVIETGGHTQSTAQFLKSDNDSGHNSDDINDEYITSERDTSCALPEKPERVKFDDILEKAESRLWASWNGVSSPFCFKTAFKDFPGFKYIQECCFFAF